MYAFLLTLGAVMIAAGLGLIASGFSFSQHTFDPTNVTPGIVAITGGCILVGLAFVVRALLRVEAVLILRPMARPASLGEVVGLAAPSAQAPLPVKPKGMPPPMPVPAEAAAAVAAEQALPPAVRIPALENAPVVEDSSVSLLPNGPLRAEDESVQINSAPPRLNGAGHGKTAQRVAASAAPPPRRPQQQAPKGSLFDSLWPKAQRGSPEPAPAPALQAVPPPPAAAPPVPEAAVQMTVPQLVHAPQEAAAAAVSILKSGVVEGMAYTLFSDGSIEAQLPGGTLRFGSITELRNHIEQNS